MNFKISVILSLAATAPLIESNYISSPCQGPLYATPSDGMAPYIDEIMDSSYIPNQEYKIVKTNVGKNNRIVVTPPLQPTIVEIPEKRSAVIKSGPSPLIKTQPTIYQLQPSVIYQHEVIKKHPAPLHIKPVYVNLRKSRKNNRVLQQQPVMDPSQVLQAESMRWSNSVPAGFL